MNTRRSFSLRALILGSALCAAPWMPALAQSPNYPSRPIRLIIPFAPGGVTDSIGRLLATSLSARLGQPIVADNRAGAGGQIGTAEAIKQAPDGYTLVLTGADALAMAPAIKKNKPYDSVNDLAAISLVANSPLVFAASNGFPAKTMPELIAAAKAAPDRVTYGSAGVGSALHLGVELLEATTGTKMVHVPYQGGAPMMQALVSGQVDFVLTSPDFAARFEAAGKSHSIAQADLKRHPLLPEVPTASEQGLKDFVVTSWFGLMGPARLPRPIVERLDREVAAIARDPAFQAQLVRIGAQVDYMDAGRFHDFVRTEVDRWAKVVQNAQIPLQD